MERNQATYDRLFDIADRVMKRYNPCAGCTGCHDLRPYPFDCCEGCPFLGPQGCTTRSIACKIWLCEKTPRAPHPRMVHQLQRIARIAYKLNMHYARATPEEVMALAPDDWRSTWFFYYSKRRTPKRKSWGPITIVAKK